MTSFPNNRRGIGLLEVVLALGIIAILVFSFGFVVPTRMEADRENRVRDQLLRVKQGIIGQPSTVRRGSQNLTRFGYVGDMGGFPDSLDDLVTIGSQTGYAVAPIVELGAGWRGPYIPTGAVNFLEDPWGFPLEFDTTPGTSAATGSAVIATIRSIGRDGVSGTSDDEVVEIYEGEAVSDVFGYIRDTTGNTIAGVVVTLSYADNGSITSMTDTTDLDGLYMFDGVPHGERVIEVQPNLSYKPNTAFVTSQALDDVYFTIENQGKNSTTVNSFMLTYTSSPPAYYQEVLINGVQVFNSTSPRNGTDDPVNFGNTAVTGTGVEREPLHVVVSSLDFQIPEIGVDTVGIGGTLEIELNDFRDAATGGGANTVNMTGVTFEMVFSDGSTTVFTTRQEP